jgi:formyltetrahydrofolate hydrolase
MKIKKINKIFILSNFKHFNFKLKNLSCIKHLNEINEIDINENNILISCITGIIVPEVIFKKFKLAINIHPASESFPGRDPHHWACYAKSSIFGAVAHFMEEKVDSGSIIDFETTNIKKNSSPKDYQLIGNKSAKILINKVIKSIYNENISIKKIKWSKIKTRRSDIIKICDFRGLNQDEIKSREFSFQGFEKYFKY